MSENKQNKYQESQMRPFGEKELMDILASKQTALEEAAAEEAEKKAEEAKSESEAYDPAQEREDKLEQLRENFDNLSMYEPHTWSHNTRYLPGLLKDVNPHVGGIAVDTFCQRGDLARTLSSKFSKVIGIDLSQGMIDVAESKNEGYDNVEFVCGDFLDYDIPENSCGLITMVATLHHMPKEETIAKVKRCLKPSGRLIIVDMYRPATLGDIVSTLVSGPLNKIGMKLFDKHHADAEEMSHWREHSALDWYDTIPEMRRFATEHLPGAQIRRRLFCRYTLVWVKP